MTSAEINILVVEDEPISAKLAHDVLATEGYTVRTAETAEQALSTLGTWKPSLILLDLALPGIDGLTFARYLKQNPQTQDIVIIIMTAFSNRWSQQKVMNEGCDVYLVKPLGTHTLCDHVAKIAAQRFGITPST